MELVEWTEKLITACLSIGGEGKAVASSDLCDNVSDILRLCNGSTARVLTGGRKFLRWLWSKFGGEQFLSVCIRSFKVSYRSGGCALPIHQALLKDMKAVGHDFVELRTRLKGRVLLTSCSFPLRDGVID